MRAPELRRMAAALAAVTAVLACGGDGGGTTTLTQDQAGVIGEAAAGQVGGLVSGLTHFATPDVGGLGTGFFAPRAPGGGMLTAGMARLDPRVRQGLARLSAGDCNPAQSDSTDTDGDGIQDDNTFTFTAANCSFSDTTQGQPVTFTLTGTVRVQDTDGAATFFGYRVGISSFTVTISDTSGNSVAAALSGTYDAAVQGTLATSSEDLHSALRLNGTKVYGEHAAFAVAFTPTGGTISPGSTELPSGSLTLNGSYGWIGQIGQVDGDWSFALQTPVPLAYDGGCSSSLWPFTAGRLQGSITGRAGVGFIVQYSGCDIPGVVTVFQVT